MVNPEPVNAYVKSNRVYFKTRRHMYEEKREIA